jgi:hypothetical protein
VSDPDLDPDLGAMARDELSRATTLRWQDLKGVVPWGDTFEVERSYIWAAEQGGDILCEVTVYGGPSRYDQGAKVTQIISRPV